MIQLNLIPKLQLARLTLVHKIIALSVLSLTISGCLHVERGESFNSSKMAQLSVGNTTKKDFASLFGQTYRTNLYEKDGKKIEILIYQNGQITTSSNMKYRSLTGEFIDNILNGYIFQSSFENDSTNFDESKRLSLTRNKTAKSEVLNILGKPHGIVRLPTMLNIAPLEMPIFDGSEVWIYWFPEFLSKNSEDYIEKKLVLKFDEKGILTDLAYKSES